MRYINVGVLNFQMSKTSNVVIVPPFLRWHLRTIDKVDFGISVVGWMVQDLGKKGFAIIG